MKKTDYSHEGIDIVKEYHKEAKEFPICRRQPTNKSQMDEKGY